MQFWSLDWEDALEEGMAAHSSILAWRIPWTEEPGQLQWTRSQRVGHDWSDLAQHIKSYENATVLHEFDFTMEDSFHSVNTYYFL